jgi:hypothetical protein
MKNKPKLSFDSANTKSLSRITIEVSDHLLSISVLPWGGPAEL